MSFIAASWTFNFSLCSGVCYSLAQSHWISIRRREDDCGKPGWGEWDTNRDFGHFEWVGDARLLRILSELWKLFSVILHVLCNNMRFQDPHNFHSSLQNHNKWSLPKAGRQDKWSMPKLFSRWRLSREQHHHFKCKAHNECLPAWQETPGVTHMPPSPILQDAAICQDTEPGHK